MKKTIFAFSAGCGLLLLLFTAFSVFAQESADYIPSLNDQFTTPYVEAEKTFQSPSQQEGFDTIGEAVHEELAACQASNCAFLPVLNNPPSIVQPLVFFRTSCSSSFSNSPIGSNDRIVLGSGQRSLAFSMLALGYSNASYETRFLVNGSEITALRKSGSISSGFQPIISATVAYGTNGRCQSVLPSGEYNAQFYVNGVLKKQVTAILP